MIRYSRSGVSNLSGVAAGWEREGQSLICACTNMNVATHAYMCTNRPRACAPRKRGCKHMREALSNAGACVRLVALPPGSQRCYHRRKDRATTLPAVCLLQCCHCLHKFHGNATCVWGAAAYLPLTVLLPPVQGSWQCCRPRDTSGNGGMRGGEHAHVHCPGTHVAQWPWPGSGPQSIGWGPVF